MAGLFDGLVFTAFTRTVPAAPVRIDLHRQRSGEWIFVWKRTLLRGISAALLLCYRAIVVPFPALPLF